MDHSIALMNFLTLDDLIQDVQLVVELGISFAVFCNF